MAVEPRARGLTPPHAVAPHLPRSYARVLRGALVALLLFAAGRFGWHAGGFGLALTGVGIVGLFAVPLLLE